MEKTSVKQKRFFGCGLLACLFFMALFPLEAKIPSASYMRSLKVKSDTQSVFTARENGFTLEISDIEPSLVQNDLPQLPEGVQLVSSKKEEFLQEDGGRGTRIRLWFTFMETGPVRLPPLILIAGRKTFYIPFEDVTVFENPDLINPLAQVEFISGAKVSSRSEDFIRVTATAGEEIIFLLNLKYFAQIISFSWKLPEKSIFEELESSEYAGGKAAGRSFSDISLPVAKFRWMPLVEGEYGFPEFSLTAIAYNGGQRSVKMPAVTVTVLPAKEKTVGRKSPAENSQVFNSAFTRPGNKSSGSSGKKMIEQDCIKLARLRTLEKNSLFAGKVRQERRSLEREFSLQTGEDEVKKPLVQLCLCLSLVLVVLTVIFIFLRHTKLSIIFTVCSVFSVAAAVYGLFCLSENWGIFAGGAISPVPEETTSAVQNIDGGLRVKILEKTRDYLYIESDEINGWVKKELVFEI